MYGMSYRFLMVNFPGQILASGNSKTNKKLYLHHKRGIHKVHHVRVIMPILWDLPDFRVLSAMRRSSLSRVDGF